jgi:hypothetical protein
MLVERGSLWDDKYSDAYLGIPTNGTVNSKGRLVMGAGVAKTFRNKYRDLDLVLGGLVMNSGNKCYYINKERYGQAMFSFPTKDHWTNPSTLERIKRSTEDLRLVSSHLASSRFVMPQVGCGLGGLDWKLVRPILEVLPDNVIVLEL